MRTVLVLGGGPDREREVSVNSSRGVADALRQAGFGVNYQIIDRISREQLRALDGDVIFPVLHGAFGEGGPLQDLLEQDGRPFVGCRAPAARLAMDKMATKMAAARIGIPTAESAVVNRHDASLPFPPPLVMKPIHDGSSVGLHLCKDLAAYHAARAQVDADIDLNPGRAYMAERMISGSELTQGIVVGEAGELEPLDLIEIRPAEGAYDYEAKYLRNDTRYIVGPSLDPECVATIRAWSLKLAAAIGVRHLCRVDFLLEHSTRTPWLLELNTMPGFTDHSLVPMAAAHRGVAMPALCARLVNAALG